MIQKFNTGLLRLLRHPVVCAVVGFRLAGIMLILWYPFAGMLVSFVFDWLDAQVLIHMAGYNREDYHALDKSIDQVWSLVMLFVGLGTPYGGLLILLFCWRAIGFLVHLSTGNTRVYIWFPNVFEFVFFWLVAFVPMLGSQYQSIPLYEVVIVSLILKEIQEYVVHIWWHDRIIQYRKNGYPTIFRRIGYRRVG